MCFPRDGLRHRESFRILWVIPCKYILQHGGQFQPDTSLSLKR